MTGTETRDYVINKFKRTDKDSEIYEAITDTIALMRVKFDPEKYKEEAYLSGIATVGDYKLGIPTDFGQLIGEMSIIDTASDEFYPVLQQISKVKYDQKYPDRNLATAGNKNTGVPTEFCLYGEQFFIGPIPDKTTYQYYINYTTEDANDVTSSTDPVPFTEELRYRTVLRNGVLFELHDGLENFQEASYYKALFLDGVNDLMLQESRNLSDALSINYNGI